MQFITEIHTLPNSDARLTQCRKLRIVQTETTIKHKTQLYTTLCSLRNKLCAYNSETFFNQIRDLNLGT